MWSTRAVALLVAVLLALGGCSFVGGLRAGHAQVAGGPATSCSPALPVLDTAAAVVGAAVGIAALAQGGPKSVTDLGVAADREVGGMFAISGAVLAAASAAYGYYENATCEGRAEAPVAPVVTDAAAPGAPVAVAAIAPASEASDRERAWTLTGVASTAASLADCETVRMLDVQVAQLDVDAHDTVFVRDPAIVRCLMATDGSP